MPASKIGKITGVLFEYTEVKQDMRFCFQAKRQ